MWAPKIPNTKSNSHCPLRFVFHRVLHLKHIPLKAHFTKLGSYKMEKIKKTRRKGNPSLSWPFLTRLLIALWKSLFHAWQNGINLPTTFTPKSSCLPPRVGRRPINGGGANRQQKYWHCLFTGWCLSSPQNLTSALLETHRSSLTPISDSAQTSSGSLYMWVYLPLTECEAEKWKSESMYKSWLRLTCHSYINVLEQ